MKPSVCRRSWEAEAIEDGRLDATARASFERHATSCEACGRELRTLARIGDAMRALPEYPTQAIDHRRARIALLQHANERLTGGHGHRAGVWTFAVVTACAVMVAIAGARWSAVRPVPASPIRPPTFEIVDVERASWTTATGPGIVRVSLSDGTSAIHVEHLSRDQKFLVDLPDGALEVRGTRFQVSVEDRHTLRLQVSEGVVALRLLGQPEIVLTAGQQWNAPGPLAAATAAANAVLPPPISATPAAPPASPPIARAPDHRAGSVDVTKPRASASTQPPLPPNDTLAPAADNSASPGDGYAACVSAFESGDYAGADHLLAAFLRDHPGDERSEDAAFLRAVSHARMGDSAGAARLARDYLHRYPQGLRQREATRLAGSVEP
jgi:TolA-binding protein